MLFPSVSLLEKNRLEDLYAYDILDSEPEKEFDDLAQLAAYICGCPIAAITFVDHSQQWFKAIKGLNITGTSREVSFCAHTILQQEAFIITDATADKRFEHNTLVTGDPHIKFYAGAPITSTRGNNLGAVCVIDRKPRTLTDEQKTALKTISAQVTKLLELRQKNKQLKELSTQTIQGHQALLQETLYKQEQKAFDLSTELHENIAQGLAATKFYLELAEGDPNPALIKKAKENVSSLLTDAQLLSRKMYPSTLRQESFEDLMEQVLAHFKKDTGIVTTFTATGNTKLADDVKITLYSIIEEQLKNIQQHAQATKVAVCYSEVNGALQLQIKDNGTGFDTMALHRKYGFNKIASLAGFYSGTARVDTAPTKGCTLTVTMELH